MPLVYRWWFSMNLKSFLREIKSNLKLAQRSFREFRYSLDDLGFRRWIQFKIERQSSGYALAFSIGQPLVSVCICTYNRGTLLVERSLRSIMAQTYKNIEIIVVGDGCSDNTALLMAGIDDPRVVFVNLPERGVYPENPVHRWMVAGTTAVNHALTLCNGQFITHLDDDDEHPPDRIAKLLALAQQRRADVIWHPFEWEDAEGRWNVNDADAFAFQRISTSSVFYHHWFARIGWDVRAWIRNEPGDWNRFRKFRFLGVRAIRHPDLMLRHYRERNQKQV